VNREYCEALGDMSQLSWEEAPDWQRTSAFNGVRFHIDNPGASPADSHEEWMKEKIADGWIFSAVKDPSLKYHPCILPYLELPVEQRAKDYIFRGIVRALQGAI